MTANEVAARVFTTFPDELALLTPNIREFVVDTFQQYCPEHFWKIPASTSGKYHPQIVLGEGGLVRHVKLAVWWGRELGHANPKPINESQIIVALLLHDIWKNGLFNLHPINGEWPKGPKDITGTHGGLLALTLLQNTVTPPESRETLEDIACAIGGHMGRWTDPQYKHYTVENPIHSVKRISLINTVHQADYCASRRLPEDQR